MNNLHWFDYWKIRWKADLFNMGLFIPFMSFWLFALFFYHMFYNYDSIIIILNGPSASGKTSVQKALQARSKKMFITVGIDTFFDALLPTPDLTDFQKTKKLEQFTPDGTLIRSVVHEKDKDGNVIVPLTIGPAGKKVIYGMHKAIAAYAEAGNNVIVDYILYDKSWIGYLKKTLGNYWTFFPPQVYMIGFKLPLDEIEKREKARKTSPVGHARSHYFTVHEGMKYDLEFTDPHLTAEQIADQILFFIEKVKNPQAFKKTCTTKK